MIDVKLDRNDRTDLYEQVAAEIRRSIADGEALPGDLLPGGVVHLGGLREHTV